jgi:hypothetical protein
MNHENNHRHKDQVDPGWQPLIQEFLDFCEQLPYEVTIMQVKEKFGGLRIYMAYSNDEVEEKKAKLEKKASETCEICGQPGYLRTDRSWIKTLCDKHA